VVCGVMRCCVVAIVRRAEKYRASCKMRKAGKRVGKERGAVVAGSYLYGVRGLQCGATAWFLATAVRNQRNG